MDSWKSYFNAMFLTNEKWCKKKKIIHPVLLIRQGSTRIESKGDGLHPKPL